MSEKINLLKRVSGLDTAPTFLPYSKVVIHTDDETVVEAGNDTGRTLEMTDPFATQALAARILARLTGYQYQPFYAKGALLDPSAEIGDAVSVKDVYGGIYQRQRRFTRQMQADIAAPHDEEINHEYAFETPTERKFRRQIGDVKASLIIANDRIDASVSQTGGAQSTFGWSLTGDGHRWFANGQEVVAITASGLKVKGEVEATSGKIGNFNISASAIWNNISEFGGTQSEGVYIGTNGLQLGQRFKVSRNGDVTATRLTVDTLVIGGTPVSAASLNSRANHAYSSTSAGGYCYGGATYGRNYNAATARSGGSYPSYFRAGELACTNLNASTNVILKGKYLACNRVTIAGNTYNLVTWS